MEIMRAKGSGTKRSDGRWVVRKMLTLPNGAKVKKPFYGETQREAQEAADQYIRTHGTNTSAPHTVKELMTRCMASIWADGRRDVQFAAPKIIEAIGHHNVRELRATHVYALMDRVSITYSGRSVQIVRNILGRAIEEARKWGWADTNVAKGLMLPKSPAPAPQKQITHAEVARIIAAESSLTMKTLYRVLVVTGLRQSEALRLTRGDLVWSLDVWWIRVPKSKTEAGLHREVVIPDELGSQWSERDPRALLFSTASGTPLARRNVLRSWSRACVAAGIAPTGMHQMRKLLATDLYEANIPTDVRNAIIGHASEKITEERYLYKKRERSAKALGLLGVSTRVSELTGEGQTNDEKD